MISTGAARGDPRPAPRRTAQPSTLGHTASPHGSRTIWTGRIAAAQRAAPHTHPRHAPRTHPRRRRRQPGALLWRLTRVAHA